MRAIARQLAWPGLLGLAALLVAGALTLLALSWREQAQSLLARAQGKLVQPTPAPAKALLEPRQLALPPASLRQQRLADLLELALHQGLVGARTEHKLSRDPATGLERLRITMPLSGSYLQLRSFISTALAHDPALSLDSLKLRRASPQGAEVEAELQWSLHSLGERAAGGPR